MTTGTSKKIHQGRNVKRFREMMSIKQEVLAAELGEDWSQKKVSMLEQQEVIESNLLSQIAQVLKVPEEAIKNFDEEAAISIISTTFNSHDNSTSLAYQSTFNFNPLDKLMEVIEENKKLYERLLESEREKIELLKAGEK